ncbi:hypothetical protein [Flagellimonas nanhaiensis]|uniref:Uncharacterized protein n=1 Tax=Flagellimonas nanhaiensis TaxID=2292706 RepID=A0A371JL78_9FLAO|nr:hypothetical protein [Allomuricauda nanhaiensis]RDY57703.1 hypothetical protein DX873_17535 [Allomuricauda nanhaiensis]
MLLSPQDFAIAIGVKYATLRSHISRKKVYKSGEYIDTDFELNRLYIQNQTKGKGLNFENIGKETPQEETSTPDNKEEVITTKKVPPPKVEAPKSDKVDTSLSREELIRSNFDLRKRQADAEKAERDSQLKQIEVAKKMGQLMPIDMVEKILTVFVRSIIRESESEWQNIASIYCEILGGDRSHLSQMVEQMNKIMDKMIKEVKMKSREEIKQVIKDYAEVRSRGQRK